MDTLLKTLAGTLVAVILNICLSKQAKDFSVLLSILICCSIAAAAAHYLEPIIAFVRQITGMTQLDNTSLLTLFKAVGIGILGEIVSHICDDTGNTAMGKMLKVLTTTAILWISLPLFTSLLELIEEVLVTV